MKTQEPLGCIQKMHLVVHTSTLEEHNDARAPPYRISVRSTVSRSLLSHSSRSRACTPSGQVAGKLLLATALR